jgi:hypothetical protein
MPHRYARLEGVLHPTLITYSEGSFAINNRQFFLVHASLMNCSILNVVYCSAELPVQSRFLPSIKGLMADPSQNSEHESLRAIVAEETQEFAPPASKDSRLALAVRA